jgi:hypothetical protein
MLVVLTGIAGLPVVHAQDARSLLARYAELQDELARNAFQRPIHIESKQGSGEIRGDIYALVGQPWAGVAPVLRGIDSWCDILILHVNVKACRVSGTTAGPTISLSIVSKYDQPLADAYLLEFRYKAAIAQDYLRTALSAADGPLGTSDYRIMLEAVSLDTGQSFLHLSYSYAYGVTGRMAMQLYLATIGRGKLGFSTNGYRADGQPSYIGGMRGVIERNTMRYYLAIEACLGAPDAGQTEQRLNAWYTGIEGYPLQLVEIRRDEYLDMKHRELATDFARR